VDWARRYPAAAAGNVYLAGSSKVPDLRCPFRGPPALFRLWTSDRSRAVASTG
jgi:hypothetical protein